MLATTVDPAAGLVAAIVAGVVGTLVFAALRSTEPPAAPARPHRRRQGRDAVAAVLPVALICFALGGLFGAAEVATVAFADEQGDKAIRRGAARPVGARAAASPGVITGAITWRRRPGVPGAGRARSRWPG